MKKCSTCKKLLPLEAFSSDKATVTGKSYKCRACDSAYRLRRYYKDKHTPKYKLQRALFERKRRAEHKDHTRAYQKVQHAVRRGIITRPEQCVGCGAATKVHAHHKDYTKPLEVTWLCAKCHALQHFPRLGFV